MDETDVSLYPTSSCHHSTLWWTCCPRWWPGSLTSSAASNPTTIAMPTNSTGRRFWSSCATLASWKPPRSDDRATPIASCLLTSWRGQFSPEEPRNLGGNFNAFPSWMNAMNPAGTTCWRFTLMKSRLWLRRHAPPYWRRQNWKTGQWGRPRWAEIVVKQISSQ